MKTMFKFSATRLGLPLFILGLGTIIALKLVENNSINTLVKKNADLLSEMESQRAFLKLENDINAIEGSINVLINSGGEKEQTDVKRQIKALQSEIDNAQVARQASDNENTAYDQLLKLFNDKANLQYQIIWAFNKENKAEAIALINSASNKTLRDDISKAAAPLLHAHVLTSADIATSLRKDGELVDKRSVALAIAAFIGCLVIIWYLLMKKRQSVTSERKVKAAASVKENFLANMSHEIRTPLNAILGFTNILQKTKLDSQQQSHIQIIQSSGNNLLSIVNDILDLSKIEAGMMRIEEAPFRVADIMATVEQMLKPKAEEKNLKLIMKVDEDIPETLCGDAVRLTQVLVNLVSNSIKFTEEGGVYVKATPYKKANDFMTLEFHVRDTGIGIPKEKQKFIFERFEQAEAATTRRFGGTGLGLSIVKHLIELQKGTITLNSEEGYGTSFLFELPFKMTNEVAPSVKTTKTNNNNIHLMNNKDCKILVAEDNIMNQHLITHLLKNWGFEFDLVFNGAQAIEALKKQNYDLILMDIQMPEMDGHTATKVIRNELKSAIPVIAMTAHAMSGEREKCIKSGMNDYISKPLNEETLFQFIVKYSRSRTSVASQPAVENNQAPAVQKGKVIDLQYIESFSEGDTELKNNMIREFVKRVPGNIHSLEIAIEEKNYKTIHSIVHDMKTTVHFMGLTVLIGDLLQKIEDLASRDGGMIPICRMFEDVRSVCTKAVDEAGQLVAVA